MLVSVDDREYTSWQFLDDEHNIITSSIATDKTPHYVNPLANQLFHDDLISVDEQYNITLINSKLRAEKHIAGVLLLENNKTFGRTENKKKLLYRCIPDNKRLPIFLVPYEITMEFSKIQTNKYIIFRFHHWNDKHPRGVIQETIGNVDQLAPYYEYRLYCRNLHTSVLSFTQKIYRATVSRPESELINNITQNTKYSIENRESRRIISIDPRGSLDIDDAIGIEPIILDLDKQPVGWVVSVYIANVYLWIEELALWGELTDRVATVYLPDGKRCMIPKILSENLCSLIQNKRRVALTLDIPIDMNGIVDHQNIRMVNTSICVARNYAYDDRELLQKDSIYTALFQMTKKMNSAVSTSHDLIEHWMLYMNVFTGKIMADSKCGIFRRMAYINNDQLVDASALTGASSGAIQVIRLWNNVKYSDTGDIQHQLVNNRINITGFSNPHYVHITSPIRRLVDLVNQVILTQTRQLCVQVSDSAMLFTNKWLDTIDVVNTHMKSTRKIQHECELLTRCITDETIQTQLHYGYIIESKQSIQGGLYKYVVYLTDLKLFGHARSEKQCEKYSEQQFSVYLFQDSDTIVKKIRLQLV
jgi:exoribonuclease R